MTNTRNTPVEALENELPVRVLRQTVRRGTGGDGARAGGDGLVRRLSFLTDVRLSWLAERQRRAPFGADGGAPGASGEAVVRRSGTQHDERLTPKAALDLQAGAEVEIRTPGGGGHGGVLGGAPPSRASS